MGCAGTNSEEAARFCRAYDETQGELAAIDFSDQPETLAGYEDQLKQLAELTTRRVKAAPDELQDDYAVLERHRGLSEEVAGRPSEEAKVDAADTAIAKFIEEHCGF